MSYGDWTPCFRTGGCVYQNGHPGPCAVSSFSGGTIVPGCECASLRSRLAAVEAQVERLTKLAEEYRASRDERADTAIAAEAQAARLREALRGLLGMASQQPGLPGVPMEWARVMGIARAALAGEGET